MTVTTVCQRVLQGVAASRLVKMLAGNKFRISAAIMLHAQMSMRSSEGSENVAEGETFFRGSSLLLLRGWRHPVAPFWNSRDAALPLASDLLLAELEL